ncbi:leucyl/phenylalanyl-tRNA--protein transferase [Pseudothauera rhizosphaerae]|uniref:Leucyl/phenylalanyl-tRNA--protein transferase n=1 Tax=Pseudothauera rhizosphaerae TaxID=2565932 RepID=A0A4S4ASG4_9RHOO|nr:leucyl/phenylalanyl-tRNA--protein transferase [Pseudothauera rhizosphaerae]THF62668.1 leucyl/phenylalanyl-tRNA--protein transferase [Pseudothauera rhizosphaerae]
MIPWLFDRPAFPPVERALTEPAGLLAAGGELSPDWLLAAYRRGIFPWYSPGEPILWWSPDPRLVLYPREIRITRSLRKTLRRGRFEIRLDTAFTDVMAACAAPREPGGGTWITAEMQAAYGRMHELGFAHSVECWSDGRLAGGLYGMALGRAFFGESMFSRETDASKVALAHLTRFLEAREYAVIDCQMTTQHLLSMGAHEISRAAFCAGLDAWTREGPPPGRWPADAAQNIDWR